jgi:hypothetical protein
VIDESQLRPLGKAYMRLGVLAYALTADRQWAADALGDPDDEAKSAPRAYVRTMLAFIEGMTAAFRDILLTALAEKRIELSVPEIFVLKEVQFDIDGKYHARARRRPMRLRDTVRFTLQLMGRVADQPFTPEFGDGGWEALLDAIAIRNRVTHPARREDLWVSDADLARVDRAVKWFEDETARFLQSFKGRHMKGAT